MGETIDTPGGVVLPGCTPVGEQGTRTYTIYTPHSRVGNNPIYSPYIIHTAYMPSI